MKEAAKGRFRQMVSMQHVVGWSASTQYSQEMDARKRFVKYEALLFSYREASQLQSSGYLPSSASFVSPLEGGLLVAQVARYFAEKSALARPID